MPINVSVSDQTISATTSGQTVAVGVSGGQGPVGPPGTTTWAGITDKPATFAPSAHSHPIYEVTGLQTALDGKQASGSYATLDGSGKVHADQLPSYVDDVVEYANLAGLPATGETGKIYVALDTGKAYRWSGSAYLEVSAAPASTDQVPEGAANLYHTTGRAAAAAPVQSVAGKTGAVTLAKSDVGLGNVDNTADASKPVSTAQAAADAAVQAAAASDATTKANAAQAAAVQRANHTGTQAISTVSGLQTALDGKAAASHAHTLAAVTDAGTAASRNAPATGNAGSSEVVLGSDTRLSDSRTPTAGSVTDSSITSGGLSTSSLNWAAIQPWAANTAYAKGDLVSNAGIAYRRSVAGTSGATFNVGNWQQITPTDYLASQIASGTIATARLATGSASSSTFLRGDQTWSAAPVTSVDGATGAITVTKCSVYTFTRSAAPSGASGPTNTGIGDKTWDWTIPTDAKIVEVVAISGGSGGGSGRRGAADSLRGGGGGGGGGGVRVAKFFYASRASNSLYIAIGAGGAGGATQTANDTNGNAGTAGGWTRVFWGPTASSTALDYNSAVFAPATGTAGVLINLATQRTAGGAGTGTAGGSGGGTTGIQEQTAFTGGSGGAGGNGTTAAGTGLGDSTPTGGGGGGGISTANAQQAGADAMIPNHYFTPSLNSAGGTAGGGNGTARLGYPGLAYQLGSGGSGGGANASGAGGNGGDGSFPGGGGGGGGASVNGSNSGKGGNGGDGVCYVLVWS